MNYTHLFVRVDRVNPQHGHTRRIERIASELFAQRILRREDGAAGRADFRGRADQRAAGAEDLK